jgi:isocitrate lyase
MSEHIRCKSHAVSISEIEEGWQSDRWNGIVRPYTPEDVYRLRGSLKVEYTLARTTAEKFWDLLTKEPYVQTFGAMTGNQAIQMVQAGLKAVYVSGWQVAADANLSGNMYPDQSLYPVNSVPQVVKKINQALQRADQIQHYQGRGNIDWFVPIVADGEAGFGGPLNAFELMKSMVEAGAAAVHFEDQLSSEKKCGHLGGKVLVPTSQFIRTLIAARLAADLMDVPTVLIARTDAHAARLITSDVDPRDQKFLTGERTQEGFFRTTGGLEAAIARGVAVAPYVDMIWCETSKPDLEEARRFADGIHELYPEKYLAYNCSPSFNWEKNLDASNIRKFQRELGEMGYKFQFITLAGFHTLNLATFELAKGYSAEGMPAYVRVQRKEFEFEQDGYTAVKHQAFVGTGYFDEVSNVVNGGESSTTAMGGSTEAAQFLGENSEKTESFSEQQQKTRKKIGRT